MLPPRRLLPFLLAPACGAIAEPGVYVWRIQKDPALATALERSEARRVLVLAAEIPADDTPVRRGGNLASARAAGIPEVVPVVRAARPAEDFATDEAWRGRLAAEAERAAGKDGVVQIDFDCPQRRLADYAALLGEIRAAHPRLRISVTGMPCWLAEPALRTLLAQTESWTLQVHLTDAPSDAGPGKEPPLCDTAKACGWIAAAAAAGKPFRVALPTYAYLAHYDAKGRFLGVESESARAFPAGGRSSLWTPDYAALAKLVAETPEGKPAGFAGFDWYRLPQDGDRLNATPAAFAKLRKGAAPAPARIGFRVTRSADGRIADLVAVNDGELPATMPGTLSIITASKPENYDLPGSERIRATDTELVVAPPAGVLAPGERRALGWIRLSSSSDSPSLSVLPR